MASYPGRPEQGDLIAGKYQVEHVLGEGAMGVVVSALHLTLRQRVAIKILLPQAMERPEGIARFLREARAAAAVQSEHVARVLDVGTLENGIPYLVMEHLSGIDFARLLQERGPLPILETIDFVLQAGEAIAEAHALGIVHRDLKPGNLFLSTRADGSLLVKVLDFGLSKTPGEALTAAGVVMGSPQYMPPEQIRGLRSVDQRADVWALGVILYRLLTGLCPFPGSTVAAICMGVLTEAPRSMRAMRRDIPEALDAVVLGCLEKDLDRRIQSVSELATRLAPFAPPSSAASLECIRRFSPRAASAPSEAASGSATTRMMSHDAVDHLAAPPIAASAPEAAPDKPWRRTIRPHAPTPPLVGLASPASARLDPSVQTRPRDPRGSNTLVIAGVVAAVIGILAVASILFVRHHRSATAPDEVSSPSVERPGAKPPPNAGATGVQGTF
ncbi:MAG: serine/threonine-protein kinase [Byssovorax sp.]